MALLIKDNGTEMFVAPRNGTDFQLEELYEMLECQSIEVVFRTLLPGTIMVIDEEGKLKGRPVNAFATILYQYGYNDPIIGHALLCYKGELK